MKAVPLCVIVALLLTGCAAIGRAKMAHELRAKYGRHYATLSENELAISEAVFRYMFRHNASAQQSDSESFFITLFSYDPPEEFLARFSDVKPHVTKGSRFRVRHGVAFAINHLDMKDDSRAEVEGGYYEGNLSASGNTYYLTKRSGVWTVESDEMHWISRKRPNQSPEPTVVLVTPRADARVAPSTTVAHL